MEQVAVYQNTVKRLGDRIYVSTTSRSEFIRTLEKRTLAMSKKNNSLARLDAAICNYLNDYISNDKNTNNYNFLTNLTGIIIQAFEDLAHPRTEPAKRFIERYNQIGKQTYENWKKVSNIRLTYIDAPDYQLHIIEVIETITHDIFGDCNPVDFAVLKSEPKVALLRFQCFMKAVWQERRAGSKEAKSAGQPFSGVFGETKFTTYHLGDYLILNFSDPVDEYFCIQFAIPSNDRNGYKAKIANCKVDLVTALRMMEDVSAHFKLEKYQAITDV